MRDFKHMHKSNQRPKPEHPSLLEMFAIAVIVCVSAYGLMWYALVQATGGL